MCGCADDARVEPCVRSVQSQCLAPLGHPVAALKPKMLSDRECDLRAQHTAQFSLGGVRARARKN
jgi:hypothetical protein